MNYYDVKSLKAKKPAAGVEMRVISGERMMMVFFAMEAGAEVPVHAHSHEQMGTVIQGSVELTIGQETRKVGKGEAYLIPSGVTHGARCLENGTEVLDLFSPPREDYR
jgi:quercetin dioxygenase-like cupin family protein